LYIVRRKRPPSKRGRIKDGMKKMVDNCGNAKGGKKCRRPEGREKKRAKELKPKKKSWFCERVGLRSSGEEDRILPEKGTLCFTLFGEKIEAITERGERRKKILMKGEKTEKKTGRGGRDRVGKTGSKRS